jgi:hypothetical protein
MKLVKFLSEIRCEDFENRYRFWQAFDKINKLGTKEDEDFPNLAVWVLEFEVLK